MWYHITVFFDKIQIIFYFNNLILWWQNQFHKFYFVISQNHVSMSILLYHIINYFRYHKIEFMIYMNKNKNEFVISHNCFFDKIQIIFYFNNLILWWHKINFTNSILWYHKIMSILSYHIINNFRYRKIEFMIKLEMNLWYHNIGFVISQNVQD